MSLFEHNILSPIREGLEKSDTGLPIHLEKLSKYINYAERGKNIIIGGRAGSGKTSFMDQTYFLNIFKWWRDLGFDEEGNPLAHPVRPPIKFIYFNMRSSARLKLQKLMCLHLKLEYDYLTDISTLLNGVGKLYDLSKAHKTAIESASEFFDELEENMHLVNGAQTPSDIANTVRRIMSEYGTENDQGEYKFNKENEGQYTMIYIDNTDKLLPESDGYSSMSPEALEKKLGEYLDEFKTKYKSTNIVVKPSKISNSRLLKDSEPSYKDLGNIGKVADVGLVNYNPFDENNNKYLNYPVEDLVIRGKNRFRTVTVVRNTLGTSNITVGLIFLGECGYFREAPHPNEEAQFEDILELLRDLP
jgi:hypothetical protein